MTRNVWTWKTIANLTKWYGITTMSVSWGKAHLRIDCYNKSNAHDITEHNHNTYIIPIPQSIKTANTTYYTDKRNSNTSVPQWTWLYMLPDQIRCHQIIDASNSNCRYGPCGLLSQNGHTAEKKSITGTRTIEYRTMSQASDTLCKRERQEGIWRYRGHWMWPYTCPNPINNWTECSHSARTTTMSISVFQPRPSSYGWQSMLKGGKWWDGDPGTNAMTNSIINKTMQAGAQAQVIPYPLPFLAKAKVTKSIIQSIL